MSIKVERDELETAKIPEECKDIDDNIRTLLLDQIRTSRGRHLNSEGAPTTALSSNDGRAVVISVPHRDRNITSRAATVFWTYRQRTHQLEDPANLQVFQESVDLWHGIERCEAAVITCTDLRSQGSLDDLVHELLLFQGLAGAVVKLQPIPSRPSIVINVRQDPHNAPLPDLPTPSGVRQLLSGISRRISAVSHTPVFEELPTFVLVRFPNFNDDLYHALTPRNKAIVSVLGPCHNNITEMVDVTYKIPHIMRCDHILRLELTRCGVAMVRLVQELLDLGPIQLGCALDGSMVLSPWLLSIGAKITMFRTYAATKHSSGPTQEMEYDIEHREMVVSYYERLASIIAATTCILDPNQNKPIPSQQVSNRSIDGSRARMIHSVARSSMSRFSSPASFTTLSSLTSFKTARSSFASTPFSDRSVSVPVVKFETLWEHENSESSMPAPLLRLRNDYFKHLHENDIVQPFDKELNWSGKGQHVTFLPKESVPLTVLSHLGASVNAKVDKVLCRRIALARKTMRCSRHWSIKNSLYEVVHLQNLHHAHIIQLVGSYLQGRDFSILMYAAADCHLGTFLEDTSDCMTSDPTYSRRRRFLATSQGCLASAVAYVHGHTTKHMDIKPQNILVRLISSELMEWRIYLADFGLSRSFSPREDSQTDGPTSRTPRYCAPEVYQYKHRGRSADIFSPGCVYLEMLTVYVGKQVQDFSDFRRGDGNDESFHANLPRVQEWISNLELEFASLRDYSRIRHWTVTIERMIDVEPKKRPTALQLNEQQNTSDRHCCKESPEPYVAYKGPEAGFEPLSRPSSDATSLSLAARPCDQLQHDLKDSTTADKDENPSPKKRKHSHYVNLEVGPSKLFSKDTEGQKQNDASSFGL